MPLIEKHDDIAKLLRALDAVNFFVVRSALKFLAYTFVRRGELLQATWKEVDFDAALWTIPAEHTKRRRDHIVPLSRQALKILGDLKRLTPQIGAQDGQDTLIFPSGKEHTLTAR